MEAVPCVPFLEALIIRDGQKNILIKPETSLDRAVVTLVYFGLTPLALKIKNPDFLFLAASQEAISIVRKIDGSDYMIMLEAMEHVSRESTPNLNSMFKISA